MKNLMRKAFSLLLVLTLILSMGVVAFAAEPAESVVTYTGREDLFEFAPGSYYTDSDLFQIYKNLMPGAVLDEVVTVTNEDDATVLIYMGALLHDEDENPISPAVLEELKADDRKGTLTELAYMHEFLEQLTLTVWKGDMTDENILYQGSPNTLEEGFEDGYVELGEFAPGDSMTLNVRLEVPIELSSEYAGRIGEVDWVFVVEDTSAEPNQPQTGDSTDLALMIPVLVICLLCIIGLVISKRKLDQKEY